MEFEHGLRDSMGGVAASGIGDGKRGFGNGTGGQGFAGVRTEQAGVLPRQAEPVKQLSLIHISMSEAALAGKRVVRLHTGDPAMYGAINEQIRALAEKGIASRIVPGVSSVFGAAAALGCELTCPDVSQSVVLTRTPGRTPMPKGENAAAFARTGATLVFFLSTGKIDDRCV